MAFIRLTGAIQSAFRCHLDFFRLTETGRLRTFRRIATARGKTNYIDRKVLSQRNRPRAQDAD